jgi:glyoxylase-like metal-dependent hydrolase (beta-lactamase superfamily II)
MPSLPPVSRFETASGVRIYRIPCAALPQLSGRVHLLLGAGPVTLVDTGAGVASTRQIVAGIERVRNEFGEQVDVAHIGRILLTHNHVDHIGGLAELGRTSGASVGIHPLDRRAVDCFDEHVLYTARLVRRFFHQAGVPGARHERLIKLFGLTPGRVESWHVDFELTDGQTLDGIRVIHTPGHAPGHLCLLVDDVLLAADHILPVTVPQQWPESIGAYHGLGHYLESLDKIRAVEGIRLALGGHEMVTREVYARVEQIRDTQIRRLDRLLDLLGDAPNPSTVADLAARMYTKVHGIYALLALMDVGSRIEYLYQRGRLEIANRDEIQQRPKAPFRYRPAR